MASETTYNVTIPHTSPQIEYASDNTGIWTHCPFQTDLQICSGTTQPDGYHFTNVSGTFFKFYFWGKSIYIYGDADPGMTVQLTVNNGNSTLTPANGMLASIDDITTICTSGNCVADASNVPLGNSTRNFAIITVSQQTAGASVTFYKASFFYPTHRSNVTTSIKSYTNSDAAIQYSTGWAQNGSYVSTVSQMSDNFNFLFDGQAIWVWGFCGPRQQTDNYYGKFTIDNNYIGGIYSTGYMSYEGTHLPQDENCLIWFTCNLPDTGNHLYYESDSSEFNLKSIDILQVSGAATSSPTATVASSEQKSSNVGAIAGGVVGGVLFIGLIVAAAFLFRRYRRLKKPPSITPFVAEEEQEAQEQEQPMTSSAQNMSQTLTGVIPLSQQRLLTATSSQNTSSPRPTAPSTTNTPPANPVPSEPPPPYA